MTHLINSSLFPKVKNVTYGMKKYMRLKYISDIEHTKDPLIYTAYRAKDTVELNALMLYYLSESVKRFNA